MKLYGKWHSRCLRRIWFGGKPDSLSFSVSLDQGFPNFLFFFLADHPNIKRSISSILNGIRVAFFQQLHRYIFYKGKGKSIPVTGREGP
jgi:hypothetical protein